MNARGRATLPLLVAIALVLLYGARAATGWLGGMAYGSGRRMATAGRFEQALPLLERGAIGSERAAMLWLAGEARLGLFQSRQAEGAPDEELDPLLLDAFTNDTEAISLSPASGWYWAALADVYQRIERRERFRHGLPLELVDEGRWAMVGRPGRIAVGALRTAIEREPTQYTFHDQLAFALLDYGLRDEALEAVRESARVHPDYGMHAYVNLRPVPADVLDTFAEASRATLGDAPLLHRVIHLLALGRLELRRGNPRQAEQDVRAALESPGTRLNHAEAHFRLGQALEGQLRFEEAVEAYSESEKHQVFEPYGLVARARIAEGADEPLQALALLRRARRLRPREIGYALEYARIARGSDKLKWAEEALRWAITVRPSDPQPLRLLEETLLEQGEKAEAGRVRRQLDRLTGETPEPDSPPKSKNNSNNI
jgi:tetratricopeptide (TPR) repeat protein